MKPVIVSVLPVLFFFCTCSDNKRVTGIRLMPGMQQTDSLELIFFKEPENQRFFTYHPTTDKELIAALVKDVSGPVQPENSCMKEGKIYCFKKGEIFHTIYFAYLDPSCKFLRYIKNGNLYYFPLSEALQQKLEDYKAIAKEPVSADSTNNKLSTP